MPSENTDATALTPDKLLEIYKDICNNIRVSDEISFKLLGIVPVASGVGAGVLTVLEKADWLKGHSKGAIIGLSVVGALVTVGLFKWELRNIQKCNWLISRAARFEKQVLCREYLQYDGLAPAENIDASQIGEIRNASIFKAPWGKTQAEKLIYIAAIIAWLVPLVIAILKN